MAKRIIRNVKLGGTFGVHCNLDSCYILYEVGGDCRDWMELAQDRERWWALVGPVMNLRVQ